MPSHISMLAFKQTPLAHIDRINTPPQLTTNSIHLQQPGGERLDRSVRATTLSAAAPAPAAPSECPR
ncbi:unnamed protein product [Prunus armeniaca]